MAFASVYYYNKNKVVVSVFCSDNKPYYLAPRAFTFLRLPLKTNYNLPSGVVAYSTPGWFQEYHWPHYKPWEGDPGV